MPPFLMSILFSLILNVLAPHSNVVLPHAHGLSKIDQRVVDVSFE